MVIYFLSGFSVGLAAGIALAFAGIYLGIRLHERSCPYCNGEKEDYDSETRH
jgi:hypothetical protein